MIKKRDLRKDEIKSKIDRILDSVSFIEESLIREYLIQENFMINPFIEEK